MRRTLLRLLSSFRSSRAERELTREIRSHLHLLEDQYIARGMDAEKARDAALRAFGGVEQVKEHQRDVRMFRWLAGWPMDLKLGGRMLVKYPGLTIVGGLAMAFAIWVGIVIVQVVSLFTNPTLPISEGARLVEIRSIDVAANVQEQKVLHDFLGWQQSLRALTDVGAWRDSSRNLVVAGGDARPVKVAEMSVSGFRVADGEPLLARRGDCRGRNADQQHHGDNRRQDSRIRCADLEQEAPNYARQRDRPQSTPGDPEHHRQSGLSHDHRAHLGRPRTERRADVHLAPAL